jgi:hypothetical protein
MRWESHPFLSNITTFTDFDVQQIINILQQQKDVDTQLESILNAVEISTDGRRSKKEYECAVERAGLLKMQGLESLDTEEEKEPNMRRSVEAVLKRIEASSCPQSSLSTSTTLIFCDPKSSLVGTHADSASAVIESGARAFLLCRFTVRGESSFAAGLRRVDCILERSTNAVMISFYNFMGITTRTINQRYKIVEEECPYSSRPDSHFAVNSLPALRSRRDFTMRPSDNQIFGKFQKTKCSIPRERLKLSSSIMGKRMLRLVARSFDAFPQQLNANIEFCTSNRTYSLERIALHSCRQKPY